MDTQVNALSRDLNYVGKSPKFWEHNILGCCPQVRHVMHNKLCS